jgi:hypothetical protein
MRLLMAEELFTFVLVPEVEATNNSSERRLRNPAQERKTYLSILAVGFVEGAM